MEKHDIKDNIIENLKEDIECVHMYLDDLGIPRKCGKNVYSLVGRIKQLQLRMLEQTEKELE